MTRILYLIILGTCCISCTTQEDPPSSTKVQSITTLPDEDTPSTDAELLETYVDSLQIGVAGKSKIELTKFRLLNDIYVMVKFYNNGPDYWQLQNTYFYECTLLMNLEPHISDFNNDNFKDLTFISATAARGSNEVRRLFIYDDKKQSLTSIENAEEFPNMRYNEKLNCIDAFLVHGTSTTVFAHIVGDSLVRFAKINNDADYHIVSLIDKNGVEKEIKKVKSKGIFIRFKDYKTLEEYDTE